MSNSVDDKNLHLMHSELVDWMQSFEKLHCHFCNARATERMGLQQVNAEGFITISISVWVCESCKAVFDKRMEFRVIMKVPRKGFCTKKFNLLKGNSPQ